MEFNLFKVVISIHAAREGGDGLVCCACVDVNVISIHAAREGGDTECGGLYR